MYWLHLRWRALPTAVAGLILLMLLSWAAGTSLAHPEILAEPGGAAFDPWRRVPVVAAAPVAGVLLFSNALVGHAPELEATTPNRWWLWRCVQLITILLLASSTLAVTVRAEPTIFGAAAMIRNVTGYLGLMSLSTAVLGAARAWAPPLIHAAVVYLAAPRSLLDPLQGRLTDPSTWWAWPMRPGGWDASWISAGALFAIGAAVYVRYGSGSELHSPGHRGAPDTGRRLD